MALNNMCIFEGNTTKDFDITITPTGKKIAKVCLAVSNGKDPQSNEKRPATFVYLKVFGDLAGRLADNVGKGSLIKVGCRFDGGSFEGQDGKRVNTQDFIVNECSYGSLKAPNGGGASTQQENNTNNQQQNNPQGQNQMNYNQNQHLGGGHFNSSQINYNENMNYGDGQNFGGDPNQQIYGNQQQQQFYGNQRYGDVRGN